MMGRLVSYERIADQAESYMLLCGNTDALIILWLSLLFAMLNLSLLYYS